MNIKRNINHKKLNKDMRKVQKGMIEMLHSAFYVMWAESVMRRRPHLKHVDEDDKLMVKCRDEDDVEFVREQHTRCLYYIQGEELPVPEWKQDVILEVVNVNYIDPDGNICRYGIQWETCPDCLAGTCERDDEGA